MYFVCPRQARPFLQSLATSLHSRPPTVIALQLLCIIGSNDVAEEVPKDDKYKYIDDLATLEAVDTKDKFIDYDYRQHVPSDIVDGQKFLAPHTYKSEIINQQVASWTQTYKMKLNSEKSKYMIFSR